MWRRYFLGAILSLWSMASGAESVRVYSDDWPPYTGVLLPEQGLAVAIVRHVLYRAGYQIEPLVFASGQRPEAGVIPGSSLLVAATQEQRSDERWVLSQPYLFAESVLLVRGSEPGWHASLDSLLGWRLGLIREAHYPLDPRRLAQFKVHYEDHLLHNLLNLIHGRVDLVLAERRELDSLLQQFLPDQKQQLRALQIPLPPQPLSLGVPKHQLHLVAEFNEALRETKRDGSYQQIIDRWQPRREY